jgi:hypothetical protein
MVGWHVQVFNVNVVEIGSIAISGDVGRNPGIINDARKNYCTKELPK